MHLRLTPLVQNEIMTDQILNPARSRRGEDRQVGDELTDTSRHMADVGKKQRDGSIS